MTRHSHRALAAGAVLACALIAAPIEAASQTAPVATAAKTCTPPRYPGDGYFTSLRVTRVSCSTGKKVAVSYYRCRTKRSAKGRCTARVRGYRCKEKRTTIPTEINARVTCRRGARRIVHTYQQNT